MNCLIGVSLTLIAIVAGMLLLAKTLKDNLGNVYKAVSYFVIVTAFLGFLAGVCCGLCQFGHCGKGGYGKMEKCQMMGGGGCMMGGEGHCRMGSQGMGCGDMAMSCGKGMKKKCKKMCKKEMMGWNEDEEMEEINVEIIQKEVAKEPAANEKK